MTAYLNLSGAAIVPDWSSLSGRIGLGLCTVNHQLAETGIYPLRSLVREEFTNSKARDLALQNIADLLPMFRWNAEHGIHCYRLPSNLFPCLSAVPKYSISYASEALNLIGQAAKLYHQRITIHSSLRNHLASPNPAVVEATIKNLSHQADVLELMDLEDPIIIIHGGGTYGDKAQTKLRWIQQFAELPYKVRSRLGIENCEHNYGLLDVLDVAEACNIPVVFDLFHHPCYNYYHPEEKECVVDEIFTRILGTWQRRQNDRPEALRAPARRPLFHISEQFYDPAAARLSRIGKHSEYINDIPIWFLSLLKRDDISVDIEVEATANERAILRLYQLYPQIFESTRSRIATAETPCGGESSKTTLPIRGRLRIRGSTRPIPTVTGDVLNLEGGVDLDYSSEQTLRPSAEAKVDDDGESPESDSSLDRSRFP